MATLLVTGVSGFIGSSIAQALIRAGHRVLGTYHRNPPRLPESPAFKSLKTNLTSPSEVRDLLSSPDWRVEGIIHVAGLALDWGKPDAFEAANVSSALHLLEQAEAQSMCFFLYTSSISVHGFGRDHVNTREDGPYTAPVSHYQRSKLRAESLVLGHPGTVPRSIIRPGNVYGPGDTTTLYNILGAMRRGIYGYIDRGRSLTCPVYIDDLVQAYARMVAIYLGSDQDARNRISGQIYNITSGETITWRAYSELAADFAGLTRPKTSIPAWLGHTAAALLTLVYRLLGIKTPPPLTRYRVQQAGHHYHFSMDKARSDLGYQPQTPCAQGLEFSCQAWKKDQAAG